MGLPEFFRSLSLPQKFDGAQDRIDKSETAVGLTATRRTATCILGVEITEELLKRCRNPDRPQGVLVAIRNSSVGYAGPQLQVGDAIYELSRQIVSSVEGQRLCCLSAGRPPGLCLA
jgi:hypothetical protein